MDAIDKLQSCKTRRDLAILLNYNPSHFTHLLYHSIPEQRYKSFLIPKKNGGERSISAPNEKLKQLQRNLSNLLLECIDNINKRNGVNNSLSHGFVRERSIITNAEMHKNKKNVLNIDLENFFGSFNFGRVSGFFIKNNSFLLEEVIATTIAQICCFNNELPQGSPCSPVITNLITHSLDIRLASLAKKYSCTYTRYVDDITFSTRKSTFPIQIMNFEDGEYLPSQRLLHEITRSGFNINNSKTRIQFKDSRQDVTGLIVNKKVGVKREYRQLTKAMCNKLFNTGRFTKEIDGQEIEGSLLELEGQLNFIDSIDYYNRVNYPQNLSIHYTHRNFGFRTKLLLNGREKILSKFLFYKNFYSSDKPTILCEGKTDNVYLLSALHALSSSFKKLATPPTKTTDFKTEIKFLNYTKRTKFLLELAGGTSYLAMFIANYHSNYIQYKAPKPKHPVIIILDNDEGLKDIINELEKIKTCTFSPPKTKGSTTRDAVKTSTFVHVVHNLYLVITPLSDGNDTMIENFFEKELWETVVNGRKFDPTEKKEPKNIFYGKNIFANDVVKLNRKKINFEGFRPLFYRLEKVISNYNKI
ncbi:Retron-type reverse transcriptase [Shewanella baltica]|uniref:retron Ec67 family RNA-directed DNA polymerase/endonuclease n=1 Tax=Shewanella TaxID=22 RepID=UPI00090402AB|nr:MULTISPECIES: retron Ec67 family RNA-directed DNA polymerase/endonuclease [Shewanella]OUS49977.1 ribonuclease H [Shewanella sp. SACH]WAL78623.1 retron Ec67 family RNA-directed DNA polymerase/endonuclease [Shewanella sp. DAU305]VEF27804.1 Retron-type reverse transcriptase [Shewanella baltica]